MAKLVLSSRDTEQLSHLMAALLSPLEYGDASAWAHDVARRCMTLLGADQALGFVPQDGTMAPVGVGAHQEQALRQYVDYYWRLDTGMANEIQGKQLEVYDRATVLGAERARMLAYDEFHADWALPNRLADVVGIQVASKRATFSPVLHFYHDDDSRHFGDRGIAILRLIYPAYKSGVETLLRLERDRASLARILDASELGMLVTRLDGEAMHQNPAMTKLLWGLNGAALAAHVRKAAVAAGRIASQSIAALPSDVEIGGRRYRICASLLSAGVMAPEAVVVTSVEATGGAAPDAELRERFGLTSREIEIARLMSSGKTSRQIAGALGISIHTSRRHSESVLRKLRVGSRYEVKDRLA